MMAELTINHDLAVSYVLVRPRVHCLIFMQKRIPIVMLLSPIARFLSHNRDIKIMFRVSTALLKKKKAKLYLPVLRFFPHGKSLRSIISGYELASFAAVLIARTPPQLKPLFQSS